MNPPFREVRKHIAAARDLMGPHGHGEAPTLVALVPITFQTDGMETLEHLPDDTFDTAKVRTKIIRIRSDPHPTESGRKRWFELSPIPPSAISAVDLAGPGSDQIAA
jgi:hypothetical protein